MGSHVCFDEFRDGQFPSGLFGLICQHSDPFSIYIYSGWGGRDTSARGLMNRPSFSLHSCHCTFGWGLCCHVYHRRVYCPPQLRGWGYALDRDVRGFHFGWKWKFVKMVMGDWAVWSLFPNSVHGFFLGGGSIWGDGTTGKCLRMTNTI